MIVKSSCSRYKSFNFQLLNDSNGLTLSISKNVLKCPFKAHVWTLRHKDTVLLHRPYMRALRRIAGAGWKSNETTPPITDNEVRRRLGAPSIECLLIKVRLQYQGRVCRERHHFPTLWAILDKKCGSAQKGWWLALQGKHIWQEGWWVTCQESPSCESMDLLRVRRAFHLRDGERPARKKETWTTMHSLAKDWRHLNMSQLYADFRQRFRLVHHAREKRGKERDCRDFWLVQSDVDSDLADSLWEQDLTLQRAARKEDRSHAIACGPARRHDGRIIDSQSVLSNSYRQTDPNRNICVENVVIIEIHRLSLSQEWSMMNS